MMLSLEENLGRGERVLIFLEAASFQEDAGKHLKARGLTARAA